MPFLCLLPASLTTLVRSICLDQPTRVGNRTPVSSPRSSARLPEGQGISAPQNSRCSDLICRHSLPPGASAPEAARAGPISYAFS